MNFCQFHWDFLREKVQAAGLSSLVSESSEIMDKTRRQLEGEDLNLSNYDPLMSAMLALTSFCYNQIGPGNTRKLLLERSCPVCITQHVHDISCEEAECDFQVVSFFDNAVADEVERSVRLLSPDDNVP